ncbi:MAG: hypothetical protein OEZ36_04470 [Spirochaetota bacterium]|nr:hypothetical protein [Spirochaetota bacterium]
MAEVASGILKIKDGEVAPVNLQNCSYDSGGSDIQHGKFKIEFTSTSSNMPIILTSLYGGEHDTHNVVVNIPDFENSNLLNNKEFYLYAQYSNKTSVHGIAFQVHQ